MSEPTKEIGVQRTSEDTYRLVDSDGRFLTLLEASSVADKANEYEALLAENKELRMLQPEKQKCGHPTLAIDVADDIGSTECSICGYRKFKAEKDRLLEALEKVYRAECFKDGHTVIEIHGKITDERHCMCMMIGVEKVISQSEKRS